MIPHIPRCALGILFLLAACAGPDDAARSPEPQSPAAEVVGDVQFEAAPVAVDPACDDPGDGIGGTGCAAD